MRVRIKRTVEALAGTVIIMIVVVIGAWLASLPLLCIYEQNKEIIRTVNEIQFNIKENLM